MTHMKHLSDKLLKYAGEKIHQRSIQTTERLKKCMSDLSIVSRELAICNRIRVFNKHLLKQDI